MAEETDSTSSENDSDVVVENISDDESSTPTEIQNNERKWNIGYFFIVIPIIVLLISLYLYKGDTTDELFDEGFVGGNVYNLFLKYDRNGDGQLSPVEFQIAYFDIKAGTETFVGTVNQREKQNPQLNVTRILENQTFTENEEVLNLKSWLTPMDINTMSKAKEEDNFLDPSSSFHLHGLTSWQTPNIESARFAVSNFSVFLPKNFVSKNPGSTWSIIEKVMAGFGSANNRHLGSNRYWPPHPGNPSETLLHYLLSMIHKQPFLHMRFPPRGAVACLRAVSDDYYFIMFRMHPEFQLNEPPRYPFWFTPASLIGELVIKKDGSHIEFFKMYLPTHIQLNIDMEWITGKADVDDPHGNEHAGEVDIGFMEEMRIESVHPSRPYNSNESNGTLPIIWSQELPKKTVLSILEKEFYPFKEVPYLPFNETFGVAKKENKLIHHILLWGSLDDQSC